MNKVFHLLDLPSQALALQRFLKGLTDEERLAWISARGKLSLASNMAGFPTTYRFVSCIGMECVFFISDDEFVFLGDHTTYLGREYDEAPLGK